eukprot:CAMPEP_0181228888 /NCGR_PEP_ID=MMETSP1096-20121128/33592_1 /TAXON_ID=156174 ORGANISM="Chrysochromulina ericina, Strain CCMP281" /NCGR_SAMPLE_ID=MMETSP1096 /ASSEMBLY_ACC=CAM_ASM_000453 /LENGTH=119 /DNA_ID=CAMNT_0023322451 /DNA_START=331 /DNA_END=688 /DNA_ORIENTATION=+
MARTDGLSWPGGGVAHYLSGCALPAWTTNEPPLPTQPAGDRSQTRAASANTTSWEEDQTRRLCQPNQLGIDLKRAASLTEALMGWGEDQTRRFFDGGVDGLGLKIKRAASLTEALMGWG